MRLIGVVSVRLQPAIDPRWMNRLDPQRVWIGVLPSAPPLWRVGQSAMNPQVNERQKFDETSIRNRYDVRHAVDPPEDCGSESASNPQPIHHRLRKISNPNSIRSSSAIHNRLSQIAVNLQSVRNQSAANPHPIHHRP